MGKRPDARFSPDWVREAVIYEVYLRSFSPEGTFEGLRERLDQIRELGVTVLWLMPIHPVGRVRRKGRLGSPYAVRDYYSVNDEFGSLEDFQGLVDAVHDKGLRIIIDLVANHTAWDHHLIQEHPDWFSRGEDGRIRSPNPEWTDVARLNYDNPELRRYMIDMMSYWVREHGIDGYRCDVAELVPLDFWEAARAQLDQHASILMVAEGEDPRFHLAAFDITFSTQLFKGLLRRFQDHLPATSVAETIVRDELRFPKGSLRLRFTSNHDENAWKAPDPELFGLDGARAVALLAFCLPGVPLIYNGQEVGNRIKLPLFEKKVIAWGLASGEVREFYRSLLKLRRDHLPLMRGGFKLLHAGAEDGCLAFKRPHPTGEALVAVSLDSRPGRFDLPDETGGFRHLMGSGSLHGPTVRLPPYGYWVGISG